MIGIHSHYGHNHWNDMSRTRVQYVLGMFLNGFFPWKFTSQKLGLLMIWPFDHETRRVHWQTWFLQWISPTRIGFSSHPNLGETKGVSRNAGTPIAAWGFNVRESPNLKRMINGGTLIYGNPQMENVDSGKFFLSMIFPWNTYSRVASQSSRRRSTGGGVASRHEGFQRENPCRIFQQARFDCWWGIFDSMNL